jgi:hypothetical protein
VGSCTGSQASNASTDLDHPTDAYSPKRWAAHLERTASMVGRGPSVLLLRTIARARLRPPCSARRPNHQHALRSSRDQRALGRS